MKTKLLALAMLAAGSVFAGPRVAVGLGIGVGPAYGYVPAPAPPAVYVAPAPVPVYPAVGVGFGWGPGYWRHAPYARVAPRFYGGRAYAGHFRR
jgi:hypothetical protein